MVHGVAETEVICIKGVDDPLKLWKFKNNGLK